MSDQLILMKETDLRILVFDAVREAITLERNHQGADQSKPYMNCKQAADFIGKTANGLRQLVNKEKIVYIKRGALLYFRKDDLINYLEGGEKLIDDETIIVMNGGKRR